RWCPGTRWTPTTPRTASASWPNRVTRTPSWTPTTCSARRCPRWNDGPDRHVRVELPRVAGRLLPGRSGPPGRTALPGVTAELGGTQRFLLFAATPVELPVLVRPDPGPPRLPRPGQPV